MLAVRVSPPPHPGIPHEQSIAAGPGENGGNLAIDGPTFIATEGWDWIPAIRDRNTGIWQGVELQASGAVRLLDPHVVTRLPLPRTDCADVSITVAVENRARRRSQATLERALRCGRGQKTVILEPGVTEVPLDPAEFPQLHLAAAAALVAQRLRPGRTCTASNSRPWPRRALRFHRRSISESASSPTSCRCSISAGPIAPRRSRSDGRQRPGERLVDVRHEAIKRTPHGLGRIPDGGRGDLRPRCATSRPTR